MNGDSIMTKQSDTITPVTADVLVSEVADVLECLREYGKAAEAHATAKVALFDLATAEDNQHAAFLTALHTAMENGHKERYLANVCAAQEITQIAYTTLDAKGETVVRYHSTNKSFFERQGATAYLFVAAREADPNVTPAACVEAITGLANKGMPTAKQVRDLAEDTKPAKVLDKVTALFADARKAQATGGDDTPASGKRTVRPDRERFTELFQKFGLKGDGSLDRKAMIEIATDGIEDIFKRFDQKQADKAMKKAEPTTTA